MPIANVLVPRGVKPILKDAESSIFLFRMSLWKIGKMIFWASGPLFRLSIAKAVTFSPKC